MKVDRHLYEELDGDETELSRFLPMIKGLPSRKQALSSMKHRKPAHNLETELISQHDDLREYNFTYKASRHESWWLLDSLGSFFDEQWFDDVLRIIKGGKEASVYLCQGNPSSGKEYLAAKVFRPRSLRNLRKDHLYREGRAKLDADGLEIVDDRQIKAMNKRTSYGKELMHTSWIEHEFRTLKILHESGGDVPMPHASDHNAILMDYIGDRDIAAPTLNGIRLAKSEADLLFERVQRNLNIMLDRGRVHGDLSAYNILYWEDEIYLIDFPQAINPHRNPNAYPIFLRDVKRICDYFTLQGVGTDPFSLAEELWTRHGYSTAPNFLWDVDGNDEDEGEYLP